MRLLDDFADTQLGMDLVDSGIRVPLVVDARLSALIN